MVNSMCQSPKIPSKETSQKICDNVDELNSVSKIDSDSSCHLKNSINNEPAYPLSHGQHLLKHTWQFWRRPREVIRKSRNRSIQEWKESVRSVGSSITSVEDFWSQIKDILDYSLDESVFMFRNTVEPMWEDNFFRNGGSLSMTFDGNAYYENARQTFLLLCLVLIGAHHIENEEVIGGCLFCWKSNASRTELWLSANQSNVVKNITSRIVDAMRLFHKEKFYQNMGTRIRWEWKPFHGGGKKDLKAEVTLEDLLKNPFKL